MRRSPAVAGPRSGKIPDDDVDASGRTADDPEEAGHLEGRGPSGGRGASLIGPETLPAHRFAIPDWFRLSIGAAASMFVAMGLGRFSYGPMMPALVEHGALTAAEAGYVGAGNFLGFLLGASIALCLERRFGEARLLRAMAALALLCLAASIVPFGFLWLAFWRFLVGAAVAVIMIHCLAVVTRHAPPGRLGAATGIMFTGVGLAILLTGTAVPALLARGLAAAWAGLALIGAVGTTAAFWGWRRLDRCPDPDERAGAPLRWTWTVAGLVAARTVFTLGLVPHTLFWIDYLVRGLGRGASFGGLQWTLFGVGAISGTYLWGRLADRIGFRAGLALSFAAVAVGITLPVLEPAVWALTLSSLVVGAQPGVTAILGGRTHQLVGPKRMAAVSRAMSLISGIAQAAGGYAYVALFDLVRSYAPIFLLGGAAMASGAAIALLLVEAPPKEGGEGRGPEPPP